MENVSARVLLRASFLSRLACRRAAFSSGVSVSLNHVHKCQLTRGCKVSCTTYNLCTIISVGVQAAAVYGTNICKKPCQENPYFCLHMEIPTHVMSGESLRQAAKPANHETHAKHQCHANPTLHVLVRPAHFMRCFSACLCSLRCIRSSSVPHAESLAMDPPCDSAGIAGGRPDVPAWGWAWEDPPATCCIAARL